MKRFRWFLALPFVVAFLLLLAATVTAFVLVEIVVGERAR